MYGRYTGDNYIGGNPWVLTTGALADLYTNYILIIFIYFFKKDFTEMLSILRLRGPHT